MDQFAGFRLERFEYDIDGYLVYRAIQTDGRRFLAKTPGEEFPPISDVLRLDHELRVLAAGPDVPPGVLRPLMRLDQDRTSYLLFDDFAGRPLGEQCRDGIALQQALDVSRAVCRVVAACHERHIAHLCLSPSVVLWDGQSSDVRLTHFGFAARVGHHSVAVEPSAPLTTCSAPEQTGRLALPIDERADLYALGGILYFLLCGKYPFDVRERHELIHCLIAGQPPPVTSRRFAVPRALAELIGRLLVKNPEEREASAAGVAVELEEIAVALKTDRVSGHASSRPPPLDPPGLRGRAAELKHLGRLARETSMGSACIVRISGAAGTGKTALLAEFKATLRSTEHQVLFGKFEQYQTDIPYSALLMSLRGFLERALGGSQITFQLWQERLSRIDPSLRAVLVEQLPIVKKLLGEQQTAAKLASVENENRFHNAFHALFDVLCDKLNPIVLVLDDFQWADQASVKLIRQLFVVQKRQYLLLVLAYRPLEGPLPGAAGELFAELSEVDAEEIDLSGLTRESVTELCDAMVPGCEAVDDLAELVFARSRGNALFAVELVGALRRAGGIQWSRTSAGGHGWSFVSDGAGTLRVSEDVASLIVQRINLLPEPCHLVLKVAACFGGPVRYGLLAEAAGLPDSVLRRSIDVLCAEALLTRGHPVGRDAAVPEGEPAALRFIHDRVAQATRSMCDDEEVEELHHRIGRVLWSKGRESGDEETFALVAHLNRVTSRLDPGERHRLAELNLAAAEVARASIAYRSALTLLQAALTLVPDVPEHSALRFAVRRQIGECSYLCLEFVSAEETFDDLLLVAQSAEQRLEVHRTRLVLYLHLQRYADAVRVGLEALLTLGLRLSPTPWALTLARTAVSVLLRVRKVNSRQLAEGADRTTARERRVLDLLILVWTPSFWINQPLNALVGLTLMKLAIRVGTTSESAMALACFAVFNHLVLRRYERAIEYGVLADQVAAAKPNAFVGSRVEFITLTFFGPFRRSNRENVGKYRQAVARCMQEGEHVFAGCCIDGISSSLAVSGFRLSEIRSELQACDELASRIGSKGSTVLISMVREWCEVLTVGPQAPEGRARLLESEHEAYTGVSDLLRMSTLCLWGNDGGVLGIERSLRKNQIVQSNPLHAALFDVLVVVAGCRATNAGERARRPGRRVRRSVRRLERFASIHHQNFNSAVLLARAEIARCSGDVDRAIDAYRACLSEAATLDHYLVHGLAAERLAGLHEARGQDAQYEEYVRVAAYSYGRWGASAKVKQLIAAHPGLSLARDEDGTSGEGASPALDAQAVMRASYAIAEETRSDRLTERLLTILTTTAGAQRGFLIKEKDEALWILAKWDIDDKGAQPKAEPLEDTALLSEQIVRFVARTLEPVHLVDATATSSFHEDPYIQSRTPRSILCVPLMTRGSLLAIMYLENGITAGAFGERQRRLVTMVGHQAAIALSNANYHKLQLEALQSKVNPHFLFNALSAIAELVESDAKKAEIALVKLAQLYRYMLSASAEWTVGLDEELRITRDYLALEELRYGSRLRCQIEVVGDPKRVRVPALILQPLVENGIKHGIAPKVDGGCLRLGVTVGASECTIRVADDGLGWGQGPRGAGVGLKIIRERLALAYGAQHEFSIEKLDGVTVVITLPLDA